MFLILGLYETFSEVKRKCTVYIYIYERILCNNNKKHRLTACFSLKKSRK